MGFVLGDFYRFPRLIVLKPTFLAIFVFISVVQSTNFLQADTFISQEK